MLVIRVLPALAAMISAIASIGCEKVHEGAVELQELDHQTNEKEAPETPKFALAPEWSPLPAPVIQAGTLRKNSFWNDPHVIPQADGSYVMYLTTSVGKPFKPPVLPFRAVSSDGLSWKLAPSQPLLSAEGTPYVSLETPSVVYFKGQYHLYFSGIYKEGSVPAMAIGHATSDDGIRWELQNQGKPVVAATGDSKDWNSYLVAEPGACVFNGQVYLYFSAVGSRPGGTPPQLQVIGLATSSDGLRFTAPAPVLTQTDKYSPADGYAGYSTPQPTVKDGKVYLFYDVARFLKSANPQWFQEALQIAVSNNGRDFSEAPLTLAHRSGAAWTSSEIRSPSAVFENGQWTVWYAGHGELRPLFEELGKTGKSSNFGIGRATYNPANW